MNAELFWSKISKGERDSCWLWMAGLDQCGYGHFWINRPEKKMAKAHRVAWALAIGPIPQGMNVLHACEDRYAPGDISYRRCCNTAHLKLGTQKDNVADTVRTGRAAPFLARGDNNPSRLHPERLPRGDKSFSRLHPERLARGEKNAEAKLTEGSVLAIYREYVAGGVSQCTLAQRYGICQGQVSRIIRGVAWTHVERSTSTRLN